MANVGVVGAAALAVGVGIGFLAFGGGQAPTPAPTDTAEAPAAAPAAPETVRWSVPIAFPSRLTALGDTLPLVAEMVNTGSGGQLEWQVFEPGKLIPGLAVFDSVSEGKVEAGYSWMGYEKGKVPASVLFGAVPFGLEPWQFMGWMYYGGGKDLLDEVFAPHNVKPIFCGIISPEAAGWFRFELTDLEQLQGLKVRAAGLGGEILQRVGASVTLLPGAELYQALEKGVLDGTEFSLPTVDEQLGFYKVAKFYHLPGWHQPFTAQYLYVNGDVWGGLTAQQQGFIETACAAGVAHSLAKAEALQGPIIEKFQAEGVKAVQLPDEILRELQRITGEVMAEESAADPLFAKVYESQRAFQEANQVWREFAYLPRDFK